MLGLDVFRLSSRIRGMSTTFANALRSTLGGIVVAAAVPGLIQTAKADDQDLPSSSRNVVAFYYPWYGNPATDGHYANWNHGVAVRQGPPRSYPGGEDIGANYFPELGSYSVNDPGVLKTHMNQLRHAGIGAICASWWGRDTFTDRALPALFAAAEEAGIVINFHIEPFSGRTASTTREAIAYLIERYGDSSALHRLAAHGNRPVFFVYDSYLRPAAEWAEVLTPSGESTLRGTKADAVVIGLWVKKQEEAFMWKGGFDGFYTYFATEGFTYGSTPRNWPRLADWARNNDKLFIPCVAPGYIDTRIRPWNGRNTREREDGAYYDRMWAAALEIEPGLVGITSFNEWHEGTQIEPAQPKQISDFTYLDYRPLSADYYLQRTAHWVERLRTESNENQSAKPQSLSFAYEKINGIGEEVDVCRRDPSDVIKVGNTFYVYYTKVDLNRLPRDRKRLFPSGYTGTIWCATSRPCAQRTNSASLI